MRQFEGRAAPESALPAEMFFGPIRSMDSTFTLRDEAKRSVSKGGQHALRLHTSLPARPRSRVPLAPPRLERSRLDPHSSVAFRPLQPSDRRFTRSRDEVEPTLDDGKWLKCDALLSREAVAALAFDRHSSAPHSSDRQGRTAVHSLRASGGPLPIAARLAACNNCLFQLPGIDGPAPGKHRETA